MSVIRYLGAFVLGAWLACLPPIGVSSRAWADVAVPLPTDAGQLADAMLGKLGKENIIANMLTSTAPVAVNMLQQAGPTKEQAEQIWALYMKPEFEAQSPKFFDMLHSILVEDFTVAELQSMVGNLQNDARKSAAAKVPHMQQQFQEAGSQWGRQAMLDAFAAHKAEMAKLGLRE